MYKLIWLLLTQSLCILAGGFAMMLKWLQKGFAGETDLLSTSLVILWNLLCWKDFLRWNLITSLFQSSQYPDLCSYCSAHTTALQCAAYAGQWTAHTLSCRLSSIWLVAESLWVPSGLECEKRAELLPSEPSTNRICVNKTMLNQT